MRIYLLVAALLVLITPKTHADDWANDLANDLSNDWGVELSTGYVSEYADRGTTVAGQQIQSNATLTNGAFSTGVTYSRTLGDDRLAYGDEIDINIDYGFELGAGTMLNIGADLIHAPGAGGLFDIGAADASTIEIYSGLSFEQKFSPAITVLYDMNLGDFTLEASASRDVKVSEHSELVFDLIGGFASIAGADNNLYLTTAATYTHAFADNLSAFAGLYGGLSSEHSYTDASFPAGLAPVLNTSTTSAWIRIGLSAGF